MPVAKATTKDVWSCGFGGADWTKWYTTAPNATRMNGGVGEAGTMWGFLSALFLILGNFLWGDAVGRGMNMEGLAGGWNWCAWYEIPRRSIKNYVKNVINTTILQCFLSTFKADLQGRHDKMIWVLKIFIVSTLVDLGFKTWYTSIVGHSCLSWYFWGWW